MQDIKIAAFDVRTVLEGTLERELRDLFKAYGFEDSNFNAVKFRQRILDAVGEQFSEIETEVREGLRDQLKDELDR